MLLKLILPTYKKKKKIFALPWLAIIIVQNIKIRISHWGRNVGFLSYLFGWSRIYQGQK